MRHWTARDKAAWQLVEQHQQSVGTLAPDKLTDTACYLQTARDLALKLAQHYHPGVQDPVSSLTVTEILAATQLAIEDSARWVEQFVPGSHLLTVSQWRKLAQAPSWWRAASNAAWAMRIVLQPAALGRFVTTRMATASTMGQLREHALAWFHLAFLRYVGFYLIEMNSGRLRGGATRYRDAMRSLQRDTAAATAGRAAEDASERRATQVAIALLGQVNAGKSSVVNALLGERKATVDVLPKTKEVTRYTLRLADSADELTLLDTPGYGSAEAASSQFRETLEAASQADLVLLVMNVTNPARQLDLATFRQLNEWYASQARLKQPAIVGVLTHADGLSPMMEWNPPYDWVQPSGDKERSMAAAAHAVQEAFGGKLAAVVPVCADVDRRRDFGVQQWLLPTIIALLDDARGAAVLRNLHTDLSCGQLEALFRQLGNAGWGILKACFAGSGQVGP
jgi:hypothetical protein